MLVVFSDIAASCFYLLTGGDSLIDSSLEVALPRLGKFDIALKLIFLSLLDFFFSGRFGLSPL